MKHALLTISLFLSGGCAVAHDHHHTLSREELLRVIADQERINTNKDHIIAKQNEIISCLEQELHHLKHELHKEHRYHTLVKALRDLFVLG